MSDQDFRGQDPYALCRALLSALAEKYPELVRYLTVPLRRLNPRRHGPDYASVVWDGKLYSFTALQAQVVKSLWEAMEDGAPDVGQAKLLEDAGSRGRRLDKLFEGHPAWGVLVVPGSSKGTFRLP